MFSFFTPHSGGLGSLHLMGYTDEHGATIQTDSDKRWAADDNGNLDDMPYFVESYLGTQDSTLFIVERNTNRNVCHYQVNHAHDGETLDAHCPVNPSWLMIGGDVDLSNMSTDDIEDGIIYEEELSGIEPMVYGLNFLDTTHFQLKAIPGETFILEQNPAGNKWRATLMIRGEPWVVNRIYLHTAPSLMGFPVVEEIHIDVTHPDKKSDQRSFYFKK